MEAKKSKFQAEMLEVDGSDYGKLGELQQKIDELDMLVLEKMERWEELGKYVE